jgi:hypothetical protein
LILPPDFTVILHGMWPAFMKVKMDDDPNIYDNEVTPTSGMPLSLSCILSKYHQSAQTACGVRKAIIKKVPSGQATSKPH